MTFAWGCPVVPFTTVPSTAARAGRARRASAPQQDRRRAESPPQAGGLPHKGWTRAGWYTAGWTVGDTGTKLLLMPWPFRTRRRISWGRGTSLRSAGRSFLDPVSASLWPAEPGPSTYRSRPSPRLTRLAESAWWSDNRRPTTCPPGTRIEGREDSRRCEPGVVPRVPDRY